MPLPLPASSPPRPPLPSQPRPAANPTPLPRVIYPELLKISSGLANDLGIRFSADGRASVLSVGGKVYDITDKLANSIPCSGTRCTDLVAYMKAQPGLPDINARILAWSPKLANTTAGRAYDPRVKDWASVISACRAVIKYEKRLGSFFVKGKFQFTTALGHATLCAVKGPWITRARAADSGASFHDGMAVDVRECPGPKCGSAESSLVLTVEELVRPEGPDDTALDMAARVAKKIASFYDISVADTVAVCGAVAPEVLSNGRVRIIGAGSPGLRVGRLDSITHAAPVTLPSPAAGIDGFVQWWSQRGFTSTEAVALMGAHALVEKQGCFQGPAQVDWCDPTTSSCADVRMFKWQNHYYHELCVPELVVSAGPSTPLPDSPILGMTEEEMAAEIKVQTCKFTSKEFRAAVVNQLRLIQTGRVGDPKLLVPPQTFDVSWSSRNCPAAAAWGVNVTRYCPHLVNWFYPVSDAQLGMACQNTATMGVSMVTAAVRGAARAFLNQANWDMFYPPAYRKMVERFATFSPIATTTPYYASGTECASGTIMEPACAQQTPGLASWETLSLYNTCPKCVGATCSYCCSCLTSVTARWSTPNPAATCSNCCVCSTAVREMVFGYNGTAGSVDRATMATRSADVQLVAQVAQAPAPLPEVDPAPVPDPPLANIPTTDAGAAPVVTVGGVLANPPVSPYADVSKVCPAAHGTVVEVNGFPSSPFAWTPFAAEFTKPPIAQRVSSYCKPGTDFCVDAYEINVEPRTINIGCPAGPTRFLTYGGTVPGPTIVSLKGRQTMVRFNNRLTANNLGGFSAYEPCDTTPGRQGRPISVHHHGEASLAPYDGWAEDTTCGGETKDYYYPNRRPGFQWYHDHQLEITSENAYFGMSGMYIVQDKEQLGGCGERWNLDNIPDTEMQFKDGVVKSDCQLLYDRTGAHSRSLYGDINFVNGVPWPKWAIDPTWHRLRWLNSAVSRPWKLRIVDDTGADMSGSHCWVVAGDGGFRQAPTLFPRGGLFMGVAERYEVVCDFSHYGGRTLYVWNAQDEDRMKDTPYFCHSHMLMRIDVRGCNGQVPCPIPAGAEFIVPVGPTPDPLDAVLTQADVDAALRQAANREYTRSFKFGRRNGMWVINGETWHSNRVAAADVGQNTWELWELDTGGGWFHPIHIHLVDFYVIERNGNPANVESYERGTPKDVVALHPSSTVTLLLRFGPHKGEYMFHCHNLVHEDAEMLRSFHIINANQGLNSATALPLERQPSIVASNNILYDLYDDPVLPRWSARPTASMPSILGNPQLLSYAIDQGIYRLFYPGQSPLEDPRLQDPTLNPWISTICQAQRP